MTVALWELAIVPALAVKAAVVAPAATVTDAGTLNALLLDERLTTVPPLGAASDSVIVQVEDEADSKLAGLHCSAETVGRTLIVPPVPVISASYPLGKAPYTLLNARESSVLLLLADRFAVTTATTPLPIAFALVPVARQVTVPDPELQLSVSPAAVNAEPPAMLTEEMAVDG